MSNIISEDDKEKWLRAMIGGTDIPSKQVASRKNASKPQYSLLDLKCLEPCVRALEYGANKYARDDWKKGFKVSSILDSLMRHIKDLQDGVLVDEESGLPVIAHIQANALFLGNVENNLDDLSGQGRT